MQETQGEGNILRPHSLHLSGIAMWFATSSSSSCTLSSKFSGIATVSCKVSVDVSNDFRMASLQFAVSALHLASSSSDSGYKP